MNLLSIRISQIISAGNKTWLQKTWLRIWQTRGIIACLLWPCSILFGWLVTLRRQAFLRGYLHSWRAPVPLIIIGNINIGGSGKTPTVIALAKALHAAGFKPTVLSRGYGAHLTQPQAVTPADGATTVGDEPLLMAKALSSCNIPVWVHPDRSLCAQQLLAIHANTNVLISDDGLQHYRLARKAPRDIEIVVMDTRLLGNRWLLPAGPLREPLHRQRDFTLWTGPKPHEQACAAITTSSLVSTQSPHHNTHPEQNKTSHLSTAKNHNAVSGQHFFIPFSLGDAWQLNHSSAQRPLSHFSTVPTGSLLAAAGIGYPEKFFIALRQQGLSFETLALADHFSFSRNPFINSTAQFILITEKDAVKCAHINDSRIWVVPVQALLDPILIEQITQRLKRENG